MELFIKEDEQIKVYFDNDSININTNNFFDINNISDPKEIIKYQIYNNELCMQLGIGNELLESIFEYVTCSLTYEKFKKKFLKRDEFALRLLKNTIDDYRLKYFKLLNNKIEKITIICNKANFLKSLAYANYLNSGNIVLSCRNMTLGDYYDILKDIKFDYYEKKDIKLQLQDNSNPISLSRAFELSNSIKKEADNINKLNLSNLEKIIYAYDVVKKRIYKDNEDDKLSSRDIDKVIDGDYIVCIGYARIFKELLSFLNIKSKVIISDKKKHARNLVYINDDKYQIDGCLAFDSTWDSRKSLEDKEYINKYHFFGIPTLISNKDTPIQEIKNIGSSFNKLIYFLNHEDLMKIKYTLDELEEIFALLGYEDFEEFYNNVTMYEFLSNTDKEKVKERYNDIVNKLYNTELSLNKFLPALYNTRRGQYYNDDIEIIDQDKAKQSALDRDYYITMMQFGKISELEKLLLLSGYQNGNDYLEENAEKIITDSLYRKTTTEKDLLDLRLTKVLKRRLTSMKK